MYEIELTQQLGMTSPVADVLSTVYRPGSKLRVLDLCTGSGVQGINAALHAREAVSASPECLSPSFEITLHAESRTFGVTGD